MTQQKNDLASAIHRAADLLIERDLDDSTLRQAQVSVNEAIATLQAGQPLSEEDRTNRFVAQMSAEAHLDAIDDGAIFVGFDESPYSGSANALSPAHVEYRRVGQTVRAHVILGTALEGRPGRAHGGAVAAVFDDAMGALQLIIGRNGFTRTLATTYLAPFPTIEEVIIVAECTHVEDSRFTIEATATASGRTVATATGVFTQIAVDRWSRH